MKLPWKRRYGRAEHRARKKHQYRLWVQAGRPLAGLRVRRHRVGQIFVSQSIIDDCARIIQQGFELLPEPPLRYVHPR